MCCLTTNLSFSLAVKEFLKLVKIWQSYEQDYDVFLTHSVEMCTHTEPYPETSYPYPTINPQHCTHIHTLNTQHSQECHLHTVCITENYHTPCPHLFHFFQMCARTHV